MLAPRWCCRRPKQYASSKGCEFAQESHKYCRGYTLGDGVGLRIQHLCIEPRGIEEFQVEREVASHYEVVLGIVHEISSARS